MEMKQSFSENSSRRLLRKLRNVKRIARADHHRHLHQAPALHPLAPLHLLDLDLHLLIPTNTRKNTAVLVLDTDTIITAMESMVMALADSTIALDNLVDRNHMDSVCHALLHNLEVLEDSTHNSKGLEISHLQSSMAATDLIIMAVITMDLITMVVLTMDPIMVPIMIK